MTLYRVILTYACFGIEVAASGIVQKAAPVGRWMVGKTLIYVRAWVTHKGGTVEEVIAVDHKETTLC